jgi:protease I
VRSMKSVAFLTSAEGIEQAELTEPWQAVLQEGHRPVLIADTQDGEVQAYRHLDKAGRFPADMAPAKADPADFDALVLPGGVANGDALRTQTAAVEFVRKIHERGTPIAAICHGGWILVEAGIVTGRTVTSWSSLATDYRNAGATWTDTQLVVDDRSSPTLISSRKPADLPAFCGALITALG